MMAQEHSTAITLSWPSTICDPLLWSLKCHMNYTCTWVSQCPQNDKWPLCLFVFAFCLSKCINFTCITKTIKVVPSKINVIKLNLSAYQSTFLPITFTFTSLMFLFTLHFCLHLSHRIKCQLKTNNIYWFLSEFKNWPSWWSNAYYLVIYEDTETL